MGHQKSGNLNRCAQLVALACLIVFTTAGCRRVDSGGAGVLWTWTGGTQEKIYGEGVHIVAPWNRMIVYDARIQERLENMTILTSNGLNVGLEISIRFKVKQDELWQLHSRTGQSYYEKIVKPIMRSETRKVVGQYSPEEIYSTKRLEVESGIRTEVVRAIEGQYLTVEAILLRNIVLPDKLKQAIAEKLEEEQHSLKMQYVLERERQEAERKRIEAKGIADFQEIVSKGISEQVLRWKGIEATEKLANSQNSKVVVIGAGDTGLPLILGGMNN